ncbi:MAG: potassium-transporting ATPase subunit B, partial [Acidocella sp.]|nr:potassium-transporting ATPase subunit B [Acidocella sp.]
MAHAETISLFDGAIIRRAALDSIAKLNPVTLMRNPVIFFTEIISALTSFVAGKDLVHHQPYGFPLVIAIWLWLTVLFATFAEA